MKRYFHLQLDYVPEYKRCTLDWKVLACRKVNIALLYSFSHPWGDITLGECIN